MELTIDKDNDFYRIVQYFILHRSFYFRVLFFIFLSFLVVPYVSDYMAHLSGEEATFNFAVNHTTPFVLVIFVLTYFKFESSLLDYKFESKFGDLLTNLIFFISAIMSFVLQFIIQHNFNWIFVTSQLHVIVYIYSFLGFLGSLLLFMGIFGMRFMEYFLNKILLIITIIFSFFGMSYMLKEVWRFFSGTITNVVLYLLNFTYSGLTSSSPESFGLEFLSFRVFIGNACSGIDSLALFFSIYMLIFLYDLEKLNLKKTILLFPIGMVGMFLTSILRIYILMIVGKDNPDLALGLFHTNLGWIFFVIYLLLFWGLFYSFLLKDSYKNKKSNTNI